MEAVVENCTCIDADTARVADLPTSKVDRVCAFGGLKYPSKSFYHFICSIEHVCCSILTIENFALHGGELMKVIVDFLVTNDSVIFQVNILKCI